MADELRLEIQLTREAIDVGGLMASAGDPTCGAVATFSGTVRNHHLGRKVTQLIYEAYEPMAVEQMRQVALDAAAQWPDLRNVQVVHRFGPMEVGELSIFISVATPHRVEAFAALRFVIDTIKRDVPIWKKEIYSDGASDWLHPEEGHCCVH